MSKDGTWSLDILYQGVDDPKLTADIASAEQTVLAYKSAVDALPSAEADIAALSHEKTAALIKEALLESENLTLLTRRIMSYCHLRKATNAKDSAVSPISMKMMSLSASLSPWQVKLERFIGALPNLDSVIAADSLLTDYDFYLHQLKKDASRRMSEEAENVFARMNISGGSAWSDLFGYVSSLITCELDGKTYPLPAVRAMAVSEDAAVRKAAYEAELKSYENAKGPIAFALNSIKQQVNTEAELRGYADPLEMTLEDSRLSKASLDAMWQAIDEYLPLFRQYLRRKGELLGHENGLPWYDILAPMGTPEGENAKLYTIDEAHDYLVDHFSHFAPDMAEMMDRAFKEDWIDFYPHDGKRGGAFCSNLPFLGQSRILTNFTGEFSDLVTLSHELGHAYHGRQIESHRPLNTRYTMPVAETASNFNELFIMNDAIKHAEGGYKLRLVESQIQDCTQIIVDILSRFLFEDEVIRRRKTEFLYPEQLEEIMLNAQKQAFGDGLDPDALHPYMWCCKSHYYSAGLSYYNFPYAFGGLLSRGLYARYLEEGEAFLPKYRAFLKKTTIASCEEVAKVCDIDLTDPAFWRQGLEVIAENIRWFMEETK